MVVYTGGMRKAARGIIIRGDKILVMYRNKQGVEYFTLVGGRVGDDETIEQALVREVKEETSLDVAHARLVFVEEHPEPYNEQYTFLCEVAPGATIALQDTSEEAKLNEMQINIHQPQWASIKAFATLPFRTPLLHEAIVKGLAKGFPKEPIKLQEQPRHSSALHRVFKKFARK